MAARAASVIHLTEYDAGGGLMQVRDLVTCERLLSAMIGHSLHRGIWTKLTIAATESELRESTTMDLYKTQRAEVETDEKVHG